MPGTTSVKANRFNVSRIVYALITKDDSTGVEHGAVKKLGEPMQVQFTPSYASGVWYGGGTKTEDVSIINGASLKVDVNKIAIEDRAIIGGNTYESGILSEKAGDEAPYIAIGYEIDEMGGHKELVWLLKGKAKPISDNVQQSTENLNFAAHSIDIGFLPRENDKKIRDFGDTANADFTAIMAGTFLETVPGATLVTGV